MPAAVSDLSVWQRRSAAAAARIAPDAGGANSLCDMSSERRPPGTVGSGSNRNAGSVTDDEAAREADEEEDARV